MDNVYTENFSDIMQCSRERGLVRDILNAWDSTGLPEAFYTEGVKFAFNRNSGFVFLVNDDHQCAMMNGEKLSMFYSTPYNGEEGFLSDLLAVAPSEYHEEDAEYIREAAKAEGVALPEVWL